MKYFFILILILTCSCCKKDVGISSPNGIFTTAEQAELGVLVNRVDADLMLKYQTKSPQEAYQLYSQEMFAGKNPGIQIFKDLGKDLANLTVFNKIWFTNTYPDNTPYFVLRCNTQYMEYLKAIAVNDSFIHDYANKLETACDLQPSVIANFAQNISQLDLTNKNNRLVFVVHYTTIFNR